MSPLPGPNPPVESERVDSFFQGSTEVVDGLVSAVEQRRLDEVHRLMQGLYLDAQGTGLHSIADACLRVDEVCQEGREDPALATRVLVERVDELFLALGEALDEHLDGAAAEVRHDGETVSA